MPAASPEPTGLAALRVRGVGLTLRGWWFLGAGVTAVVVAYASGRQAFLLAGCLLLALPVVGLVLVAVRRPRIEVSRAFAPDVVGVGEPASVTLTVHNRAASRSMPARWWDAVPWPPYTTPAGRLPALEGRSRRFGARNRASVSYDIVAPRRGVIPIGPLTVEVGDPFGMATATTTAGEPRPLVVTPAVVPLSAANLRIPAGDGEATRLQSRSAGDDDDTMTREYRSGDAMRRVHWRATARHGDLMVRQEEQRSLPEARIIVDTTRAGYPDASTEPSEIDADSEAFEWVVRMLASASVHLRRAGFTVAIEETGAPQLDAVARRRTWGDEDFLVRLASLDLTDEAERRPARRAGSRGPVVVLAGAPSAETVDWLLGRRRVGDLAVAFLAHATTPFGRLDPRLEPRTEATAAMHRLSDAGWLVVPVRSGDDPADAWRAVVVEAGRSRGTA